MLAFRDWNKLIAEFCIFISPAIKPFSTLRQASLGGFALLVCCGWLFAGPALRITAVGDSLVDRPGIRVNANEDIYGTLAFSPSDTAAILLQLTWRRQGEDSWWIHPQTLSFSPLPQKTIQWKFSGVALGSDFDANKTLELLAFATAKDRPAPEGVIDYYSLLHIGKAVSNPVILQRNPKTPSLLLIIPRIRIEAIDGQAIRPTVRNEVGLQALLTGEVRKPSPGLLRVVMQPLTRQEHWVSEDEPLVRDGRWSAKVDFSAKDFETESEFILFAVIAREELPRGRAISLLEWRAYLQTQIIATTPALRVSRVETPVAKNALEVKILSINDNLVDGKLRWRVNPRSGVKGTLQGRLLGNGEAVWLLATDDFADRPWRVLGKASLKSERYWELSPRLLGNTGDYLKLLAVVATSAGPSLNPQEIEENVAFSPPVHVLLSDEPPLRVTIETIDRQKALAGRELQVYRISGIEGSISGRPPEADDRVWILKMRPRKDNSWQLLGQAALKNKHSWALPPLPLGDSGEQLILIAVLSKTKIAELALPEQQSVRAASERVHVRLLE